MPEVLFHIDQSKSFYDQQVPCHIRWHPDILPVATVRPGAGVPAAVPEWFDGTIGNNDSAQDVRDVDIFMVYPISGPIVVAGAAPGDLLMADILDLGPVPQGDGPGRRPGLGLYRHLRPRQRRGFSHRSLPRRLQAVWDFHGQVATSRHLPRVRFTGISDPGIIGTAPSRDLLARWNTREAELIATAPDAVPPLTLPRSTSSRTASRPTVSPATRYSCPAASSRGTASSSPSWDLGRRTWQPALPRLAAGLQACLP